LIAAFFVLFYFLFVFDSYSIFEADFLGSLKPLKKAAVLTRKTSLVKMAGMCALWAVI